METLTLTGQATIVYQADYLSLDTSGISQQQTESAVYATEPDTQWENHGYAL